MEQIPQIVKAAIGYNKNVIYLGHFSGYEVYAEAYCQDIGISEGYPFVWLYDGKSVISKCITEDEELYKFYNMHITK